MFLLVFIQPLSSIDLCQPLNSHIKQTILCHKKKTIAILKGIKPLCFRWYQDFHMRFVWKIEPESWRVRILCCYQLQRPNRKNSCSFDLVSAIDSNTGFLLFKTLALSFKQTSYGNPDTTESTRALYLSKLLWFFSCGIRLFAWYVNLTVDIGR